MKRIVSLLLTAALAVSLLCTTAFGVPVAASNKIGDVDGDGAVAIIDATAIQRHLADLVQLSADQIARGKVCGNPGLSILDATAIQRYLAGLITAFPAGEYLPTEAPTDDEPLIETVKPTEPATQPPTQAPTQPEEVTKVKNNITIYFSNNKNWTTVNAYIYKQSTGVAQTAWPGQKMTLKGTNDIGEQIYTATVDTSKYDRVIFNNGTDQTTDTPVTKASSGYFLNSKKSADYHSKFLAGLYPYGQNGEGKVSSVSMDYPDGYKKTVYIWTPEGYNAADKSKKYSVLYMCDGQNLFGQKTTLSGFEWECDESVLSLMQNGGDGIIVVGVDNSTNKRDHELTPNLGNTAPGTNAYGSYSNGGGKVYSDFVVDTVIPYVEKNYNVNSIRGIAGSSSGGIEAFYIGMEHMDKFRYIGALSPAFVLYEKATWDKYLNTKDFSGNVPRIYFFNGNSDKDQLEQTLYTNAVAMEGWLKAHGYPAEKMVTVTDNDAIHSEGFWALYFPEMLSFGLDL